MLNFKSWNIGLISLICFLGIIYAIPNFTSFPKVNNNSFLPGKTINLGLDLQGGSYLLLEADIKSVINERLETISDDVSRKLNEYDLPYSQKEIDNGILKLNFNDNSIAERAKTVIRQNFGSELSIGSENLKITVNYSENARKQIIDLTIEQAIEIVRRRIDEIGTNEPNILKRGNDRILVELPGLDDPMRIKSLLGKTANLTFRFVTNDTEGSFGAEKLEFEDGTEEAIVSKRIILSGENLLDAQPRMDTENNETVVTFSLDRVGAKRFGKATSTGIGKRLAIVLDGKVISAPVIRDTIATGSGQISGGFTFQSATDLALLLRSGALPAPLNIIEERTVGPDLGQDSINAGMIALLIGFILVILYIFVKYKIFGIITNIALILNLFILVGILTIFEATLTLPGIAGIILTVGMAVDANVLIFERIKEELKSEKNNLIAFDSGYTKSRTAILDANITTLLAAIILFFMGSGPIKGFSLTLGIGIFTTLFTVYFIARLLTVLYVSKNKEKEGLI